MKNTKTFVYVVVCCFIFVLGRCSVGRVELGFDKYIVDSNDTLSTVATVDTANTTINILELTRIHSY